MAAFERLKTRHPMVMLAVEMLSAMYAKVDIGNDDDKKSIKMLSKGTSKSR